jgi:hypothetical protein
VCQCRDIGANCRSQDDVAGHCSLVVRGDVYGSGIGKRDLGISELPYIYLPSCGLSYALESCSSHTTIYHPAESERDRRYLLLLQSATSIIM